MKTDIFLSCSRCWVFHICWHIECSTYLGCIKIFLYRFSVYSCYFFIVFSASVRSIFFLSFIVPIFAWCVPLVSIMFLKRSLVFWILLFYSNILFFLLFFFFFVVVVVCFLRKAFLFLLTILWNPSFQWVYLYFSPLPSTSFLSYLWHLLRQPFCLFYISVSWGWSFQLLTASWTSIHSSSGTWSISSDPLNLFVTSSVRDLF